MSPQVEETIAIAAPLDLCFELSTRIDLVARTLGMKPQYSAADMPGVRVVAGSRVHWRGWKFGLPTRHHTLITGYEAPHTASGGTREAFFQDTQERGRFAAFHHDHFFREQNGITTLHDAVYFTLPLGVLGRIIARHIMTPYVAQLTRQRFRMLKALAESAEATNRIQSSLR